MERDYQGLDPSVGRKFICRMFEPRYFLIRQSITLGLGLLAALTWSVTLAFVFLSVLTVLILLKIYIWVTSLPLFRRLIRPRRIIVTAEGWWFILFTIAVGVAAINTGVSLLYLVFAMLPSLIVVSGILLELSFRKMEVERLVPPAVFCGEVFEIETVLSNHKKLFAAYSISLEEVGDSSLEVGESPYVLRVPPDGREWVRYNCVARKRGVLNLKGVVLKSVYPFGFFNKRMAIEHRDSVLVYPEIIPIRGDILPSAGQRQHILRRVSPFLAGDEDFRDLKEFREGENPRRIHWPLSAKHNKLLVREMEKQRAGRLLLVLDKSIPLGSERWVSLFEKSVSLAASILYHANERGYETALVFLSGKPSKMIEPNTGKRHLYRMLEALALVQPEVGVECDLNLPAYILRGSLVYLVAAGERKSLFEKEKSLRRAGCWVRVILADAKDGGGRQSFEVCEVRADA